MAGAEIVRARIAHTPENPFVASDALVAYEDGALVVQDGLIADVGPFSDVRPRHHDVDVLDWRDGFVVPGFVDAHVHFPQLSVVGGLGRDLLDWLDHVALPEEARMADAAYATRTAQRFVAALLAHGTTSALAFGAHFSGATASLFEAADESGVRLTTGLVLADRGLRDDLHQVPAAAYRDSVALIERYHGKGRLQYAVTPRFALSTSPAMLEVCQTLVDERPGVRVQTHLNENDREIAECRRLFPKARDYLAVYEQYGLVDSRAVFAHNVHPTADELLRLAASRSSVAHCPTSNAALGSGIFPLRRHVEAGVHCALGTDVGGGTGFGMLKEGLQAYLMQRVLPDGMTLSPAHLLYFATRAGAVALGRDAEIGDFSRGKAADFVYLQPRALSVLAHAIDRADSLEQALAAIFTLGGEEIVREVRIAGLTVHSRHDAR